MEADNMEEETQKNIKGWPCRLQQEILDTHYMKMSGATVVFMESRLWMTSKDQANYDQNTKIFVKT